MILNPNCSEVVCKLENVGSVAEAKKLLKDIGIEVASMRNYIRFSDNRGGGYLMDTDNPNSPDFENGSYLAVRNTSYQEFGGKGIYIEGHQHCQSQMYPTIDKIQKELGCTFEGYDGGGGFEELFEEWKKDPRQGRTTDDMKPRYAKFAVGTDEEPPKLKQDDYQRCLRRLVRTCLEDQGFALELRQIIKAKEISDEHPAVVAYLIEETEAFKKNKIDPRDEPLTTVRKKYLLVSEKVKMRLQPYMSDIIEWRVKGWNDSWMAVMMNDHSEVEEMTAEDQKRYYEYGAEKITEAIYNVVENKKIADVFLDEKWR